MLPTVRRLRHLLLAGLAGTVLATATLATAGGAEPAPEPQPAVYEDQLAAPEAAALSLPDSPLPGEDSAGAGAAAVVLLGSAGLAWAVRRSAPAKPAEG